MNDLIYIYICCTIATCLSDKSTFQFRAASCLNIKIYFGTWCVSLCFAKSYYQKACTDTVTNSVQLVKNEVVM